MNSASILALQAAWPALSDLLDEALALPPGQRDAWLDALDGASAQHRESLRALLATQAGIETGDFLADLPSLPPTAPLHAGAAAGAIVGPYRLISQIGRGGMASVWLAERVDGLMKRQVALKLPAVAWGETFATRLAREREILASLAHEHIARLYDAGVDAQGRPFLAMEYIAGAPIDVYCRQRQLALADRVDLLLQVMAAVTHAHGRLVVHRDLKPSNILVSAEARVSLLDFGIAKLLEGDLTEESALTRAAGHALTPDYASPEQIRGEPLGTASDVYSLAVVAYELLAGERPYRLPHAGAAELMQAIATVEPPKASEKAADRALQRQLQGDLDAILHRALKQRPDERYVSMDAFAQDLRRWRDGLPVQARPDGLAYRAAKFMGRYRIQVAAGAVAVLALLTGSTLALWQAREARAQATRAQNEAATAKAVQAFIESVFMANSGHQADPDAARQTTARELLDRGAERIDRELAGAPEAQLRLYQTMQEMYMHMALNERVVALQRRSLALATKLHGTDSSVAVQEATGLAKTLLEMDQRGEARALLLRAEAATHRATGIDRGVLLFIDQTLAFLYLNEDPVRALSWARQAAALAVGQPPSQDTINASQMLGETSLKMGRLQEAEAAFLTAEAQIARNPQAGQGELPLILSTLGTTQSKQGRPEAAGASLLRAQALARRLGDPYSEHLIGQKLSTYQIENGLLGEAVETAAADHLWAQGAGPDFGALPVMLAGQYARALIARGDPALALRVVDAVKDRIPTLPPDLQSPLLAMRADALVALGWAPDAQADVDQAAQRLGQYGFVVEDVRQVRRRWWVATGQAGRALQDFRADSFTSTPDPAPLVAVRRRAEEAQLLLAAGETGAARQCAADALATVERLPDRRFARVAEADLAEALGRVLTQQHRPTDALPPLERAVALRRELNDPQKSPRLADALAALADARDASGDRAAAASARNESGRIRAASTSRRTP
jgi:serine/threonine-protein kinase